MSKRTRNWLLAVVTTATLAAIAIQSAKAFADAMDEARTAKAASLYGAR